MSTPVSQESGLETITAEDRSVLPPPAVLQRGDELGRYVVLERLGSGGMGVVYGAYDSQLDRKVAIKLLRAHYDPRQSTEGRARLVREAKALAQLSHPNVITVHEVGTEGEQVYLAMEYVEGKTLGGWLKAQPRTPAQILEVFSAAGLGLAAAHEKGLVHRDFKPDNVMVDDSGRVRVMDFGLARTDDGEDEERSGALAVPAHSLADTGGQPGDLDASLTRGSSVMGTPAYMAAEQWLGKRADARSDQFSFCVSLYEALYGVRPFAGGAPAAIMVAVVQGDVDPAPAGSRVPQWLRRVLLRGIEREPERRHPDMPTLLAALSADPTAARRRKWLAAAVLGAGALAVAGYSMVQAQHRAECEAAGTTISETWNDDSRARVRASLVDGAGQLGATTWERLEPRLESYAQGWSEARTEACLQPMAGRAKGQSLAERQIECLDEEREALHALVDAVATVDGRAVERVLDAAGKLPRTEQCADVSWLQRRRAPPADAAAREQLGALRTELAQVSAVVSLRPGQEVIDRLATLHERAESLDYAPLRAQVAAIQGRAFMADGRMQEASNAYAESYFLAAAADDDHLAAYVAARQIFVVGSELHRPQEGELWARMAELAHQRLDVPAQDLRRASLLDSKANLTFARGDYAAALDELRAALRMYEDLLGPDDPKLAPTLHSIANCLSGMGEGEEALAVLERTLALEEHNLGPDHPDVAWTLINLSLAHGVEQRYDEAHRLALRALEIRERVYGPDHRFVGHALQFMCGADADRGRLDRAEKECARALEIHMKSPGPDHPETAWTRFNVGLVAHELGRLEDAREQWTRASEILDATVGPEHPRAMITRQSLAELDQPGGGHGHGAAGGHGPEEGHGAGHGPAPAQGHGHEQPHGPKHDEGAEAPSSPGH
ncbi:MAG: serine/threonine-protein kinase [Myxococcota bacterium]